jgi:GntR family transcriptional regulator/MocR family aminotransferase
MTGADFVQLSPGAAPVRGLTGWLADAIRAAIMDGRLRAGTPLPASRLLAGDLGVSRGVIVEAYQRLADEGLVSARPGAGTRVLGVPRPAAASATAGPPPPGPLLVPPGWRERADIDLSPGVPDLSGFPRAAWIRAERAVLERASVTELGYGDPRGSQSLRTELAGWLARTAGCSAARRRHHRGHRGAQAPPRWPGCSGRGLTEIAVEDPGSRGPGRPWPTGACGRCRSRWTSTGWVSALARSQARAVLLTPAHQFPTGRAGPAAPPRPAGLGRRGTA